jgi:uncharacterized membrane protein
MKFLFSVLFLLISFFCLIPSSIQAQNSSQTYMTGVVTKIVEQTEINRNQDKLYTQVVQVKEDKTGETHDIRIGDPQIPLSKEQLFQEKQHVVLVSDVDDTGKVSYTITDQYRAPILLWLGVLFFVIVLAVSQFKGFTSILGMVISLGVLVFYMVPAITNGANPVLISVIAAGIISALIIYLGHGFNYRSHVSLFCMLVTLAIVAIMSSLVVRVAYLNGIGDENATFLQFSGLKPINLQGLFLGGIILAALSVLDDSVVSQVSVISQLKNVKKDITHKELFFRGMEVGRDHISTLVNTLILAYAGASLPLFILLTMNNSHIPLWVTLNDQMIAEEIVRTLTGSIGLVLSIPLTTFIAVFVLHRRYPTK